MDVFFQDFDVFQLKICNQMFCLPLLENLLHYRNDGTHFKNELNREIDFVFLVAITKIEQYFIEIKTMYFKNK